MLDLDAYEDAMERGADDERNHDGPEDEERCESYCEACCACDCPPDCSGCNGCEPVAK